MITHTADRVTINTPEQINRKIDEGIRSRLRDVAGKPSEISARLTELDQEWDIERCLELGASSLVLAGSFLGLTVNRKWLVLPAAVGGFLMQHAVQGWCPPLPVLRFLGVRTAEEINRERYGLKALRGDFENPQMDKQVEQAERSFAAVMAGNPSGSA